MNNPAMLIGRLHCVPTIFSYRSVMYFSRCLSLLEYTTAWLCADAIVSNNPFSWSNCWYRFLSKVKRAAVIPNAVEVPEQYVRIPKMNSDQPTSLLFMGRLAREKNVECLLNALAILGSRHDWKLRICGAGNLLSQIHDKIRSLGLRDRVELLGYRADAYELMQQGDVLISPSWHEGMPNVFLEALAVGLPCLVSDIPAHREIVGSSGCALMFDPSRPDQLASQLDDLLSNNNLMGRMIEQGRRVARRYSLSDMVESYRQLYTSLTISSGSGVLSVP
jgi:GalNAc-alpha-(1->4)-GalNAc-alpha-(1->3)-diNAcBac-PP-undecaprenol alpha-1,4-N-acetyl-D-galactosaminyltransferase